MIDAAYSLILLLNLTGLFRVLALPFGSVSVVSAALLVANLAYLGYRFPVTRRLLKRPSFLEWSAVILLWPVASLLILALGGEAGSGLVRSLALQAYLLSLVLGAAVWVSVRGWGRFRRLAMAAVGVTIVGTVLNWLRPALFYRIGAAVADSAGKVEFATAAGNQIADLRRAAGFFIEPNLAALSCNVLMLALLARYQRSSVKAKLVIIAVMLALTAASGSRGGMLVNVIVSGLVLWSAREELRESIRLTRGVAVVGALALVVVAGTVLIGGLTLAGESLRNTRLESLADRLAFWSDLGRGADGELLEDKSLSARLEAQRAYLGFISERPLLGHGPEGTRRMVSRGRTDKMSHNLYLEKAFRYGVPYLLLLLWVLFRTYQRGQRWRRRLPENAAVTTLLVVLVACSGMVAGGVLEARAVLVVLGAVLGHQSVLRRQVVTDDSRVPAPAPSPVGSFPQAEADRLAGAVRDLRGSWR